MINLLFILLPPQGDDLSKLLDYFFDSGNPIFYSLILTTLVFYILAYFYIHFIIPRELEAYNKKVGIFKEVDSDLLSLIKLDPNPLLKIEKDGSVSAFNPPALSLFPGLTNGTDNIKLLIPECIITPADIIGKDSKERFSFTRDNAYYDVIVTSCKDINYAMLRIHDSSAAYHQQKEYDKMVEAIEKTRVFIFDRIEAEQHRIAASLHDGVGQVFTAAKLRITQLEKTNDPAMLKEIAGESLDLLSHGIQELKEVSYMLRPKMLEEMGLTAAIDAMLKRVLHNRYITYEYSHTGEFNNLPPRLEVALYRIIQETVSNIIKHAKATKLNIMLKNNKNIVRLLVVDNGVGFNFHDKVKQSTKNRSMGLVNITDRVELFEGTYNFNSSPGRGTTIKIEIPLNADIDEQTDYFGTTR